MIKKILVSILFNFLLFQISLAATINPFPSDSPVGYWEIKSTVSGKVLAVVQIKLKPDKKLIGHIVKLNHPKEKAAKLLGATILRNLKQDPSDPSLWTNGTYIDIFSGREYHCTVKLIENGSQLRVRFSTGLPLLGHQQRWSRVKNLYW